MRPNLRRRGNPPQISVNAPSDFPWYLASVSADAPARSFVTPTSAGARPHGAQSTRIGADSVPGVSPRAEPLDAAVFVAAPAGGNRARARLASGGATWASRGAVDDEANGGVGGARAQVLGDDDGGGGLVGVVEVVRGEVGVREEFVVRASRQVYHDDVIFGVGCGLGGATRTRVLLVFVVVVVRGSRGVAGVSPVDGDEGALVMRETSRPRSAWPAPSSLRRARRARVARLRHGRDEPGERLELRLVQMSLSGGVPRRPRGVLAPDEALERHRRSMRGGGAASRKARTRRAAPRGDVRVGSTPRETQASPRRTPPRRRSRRRASSS